jgi:hypothetical protein
MFETFIPTILFNLKSLSKKTYLDCDAQNIDKNTENLHTAILET